jgi:hypothetical protein
VSFLESEFYLVRSDTALTIAQTVALELAEERTDHLDRVVSGMELDRSRLSRRLAFRSRQQLGLGRARGSLRARLPAGWFRTESITVGDRRGRANVIATIQVIDPAITAEEYAKNQTQHLADACREYRERLFASAEVFGGHPGYVRAFTWHPEGGHPVAQWQAYYADAGRGYVATATCRSQQASKFEKRLRAMMEKIEIEV